MENKYFNQLLDNVIIEGINGKYSIYNEAQEGFHFEYDVHKYQIVDQYMELNEYQEKKIKQTGYDYHLDQQLEENDPIDYYSEYGVSESDFINYNHK